MAVRLVPLENPVDHNIDFLGEISEDPLPWHSTIGNKKGPCVFFYMASSHFTSESVGQNT